MRTVDTGHVGVITRRDGRSPRRRLYGEGREVVAPQMFAQMRRALAPPGIIIENVLLRDIRRPASLKEAIEAKPQAEQDVPRGMADFQRIVSQGINQPLLAWKGIEATMDIAKSPDSKVVVIGNPKNGPPLVLPGP